MIFMPIGNCHHEITRENCFVYKHIRGRQNDAWNFLIHFSSFLQRMPTATTKHFITHLMFAALCFAKENNLILLQKNYWSKQSIFHLDSIFLYFVDSIGGAASNNSWSRFLTFVCLSPFHVIQFDIITLSLSRLCVRSIQQRGLFSDSDYTPTKW